MNLFWTGILDPKKSSIQVNYVGFLALNLLVSRTRDIGL
jgi:hypothetical protein